MCSAEGNVVGVSRGEARLRTSRGGRLRHFESDIIIWSPSQILNILALELQIATLRTQSTPSRQPLYIVGHWKNS